MYDGAIRRRQNGNPSPDRNRRHHEQHRHKGMKSLADVFQNPRKGKAHKWLHYFPIYEKHFAELRTKPIRMLEIGVCAGGSLWMWKEYFPDSRITGIDIDPACKQYEGEGVNVCIGDQTDSKFLREVGTRHGPFDVILDDGEHKGYQIIASLRNLFPYVADRGLYVVEDLHVFYETYNMRVKPMRWYDPQRWIQTLRLLIPLILNPQHRISAMDYLKSCVDSIYFYLPKGRKYEIFSGSLKSITFYAGIAVIEKGETQIKGAAWSTCPSQCHTGD